MNRYKFYDKNGDEHLSNAWYEDGYFRTDEVIGLSMDEGEAKRLGARMLGLDRSDIYVENLGLLRELVKKLKAKPDEWTIEGLVECRLDQAMWTLANLVEKLEGPLSV